MKIAFIGPMGVGKSTASEYLAKEYGFQRLSFATPVKGLAYALYLRAHEFLYQDSLEAPHKMTFSEFLENKRDPRVRKLLQFSGTELGRDFLGGEDIWVNMLKEQLEPDARIVVDDCRFQNEMEMLRREGFIFVHIRRNNYEKQDAKTMNHVSEQDHQFWGIDYALNAETLDDLPIHIDYLMGLLRINN